MSKFTIMLSAWLWGGIFSFLFFLFYCKKEIKKAELDSVYLCAMFFIFCLGGILMFIKCIQIFIESFLPGKDEGSFEENVDLLVQIKERIEQLIMILRK